MTGQRGGAWGGKAGRPYQLAADAGLCDHDSEMPDFGYAGYSDDGKKPLLEFVEILQS